MNDEIKEILEGLNHISNSGENASIEFNSKDCKLLSNCITNLQEENERLISENETIKNVRYMVNETIYKLRIDKAIEYIKEKISSTQGVINDYMYHKEHNKILIELLQEDIEMYKKELNILNGSDE